MALSRSSFDIVQWLDPSAEKAFLDAVSQRSYSKGQTIFSQSDDGGEMYRITEGSVRISQIHSEGREVLFFLLGPCDCFGANSVIDHAPRQHTASAVGYTRVQVLARKDFVKLRKNYPLFNDALLLLLAAQMRTLNEMFAESLLEDMPERLLQRILAAVRVLGVKCDEGVRLTRRVSQSELALMIGVSRKSVNRVIGEFQEQGLLSMRSGTLVIHDLDKLEKLARNGGNRTPGIRRP